MRLGFCFPASQPPEAVPPLAGAVERAGLHELWLSEDCFAASGIACAGAALAATSRLTVGLGLLPVPLHTVAQTAMEIATLGRLHPGRVLAGVGHGIQPWMAQAGVRADSPLTLLREFATALRGLLDGEEVSAGGRYVRLDRVRLEHPPARPVPLLIGAGGPRTLALAGELGDGTLLPLGLSEEEIRTAGRATLAAASPVVRHRLTAVLTLATGPAARERVEADLRGWGRADPSGVGVAGEAEAVAAAIDRLAGFGVTSVAVHPTRDEPDLEAFVSFLGQEVRPLLS